MKNLNLLFIILLGLIFSNCRREKHEENSLFLFDNSKLKSQYKVNEVLDLSITNTSGQDIDSLVFYLNDKKIGSIVGSEKLSYKLTNSKFGIQKLKAVVYFDGESAEATSKIEVVSSITPKLLKYTIVNTYPHDTLAYTQGIEFYRDTLYESTGNGAGRTTGIKGMSSLRKTDYKTGRVYKKIELEEKYFGEGITVLQNKVYQLTYLNNDAFVYNADNFKQEQTFKYPSKMEGWGLTTNGKYLYMTDSSEKMHILDPKTFKEVDYINIYSLNNKIVAVNELEWINGKIYANIYDKDVIVIIDPKSGAIEGIINLADLYNKITERPDTDVLNGIAYNAKNNTLLVTGKNWDKMFEIKILGQK